MNPKVIITCAVTGAGDTPGKSEHVPVTPVEIADACLQAADAGAAICHIHVRDPVTSVASRNVQLYREVVERIRVRNNSLILNLTGGMGADIVLGDDDPLDFQLGTDCVAPMDRIPHILELKPEIASLDIGTMNFDDVIYATKPAFSRKIARAFRQAGVRPEIEVFDLGHIELAKSLMAEGEFVEPTLFQLCLGVRYGAPATTEGMKAMRDSLPDGSIWAAFGIGRQQFPMVAQAVLLGGHVRIGLEDNLYLKRGVLATNGELVDQAANIIRILGADIASPDEAREILQLRKAPDA
ncbi:3-keto-5-aminohexanoate cleavage enzyme [Tsuneonella dongtanensis]|uniref:3-keto-5-aminohexanoate cleavage enzyme n=1 Tax=Tsuneonella dongtanensis TaxID=692370 RepID=A0A1B2A8Z9_9SPHN|nr:3-keto-5-aminohexanoate cleavage protein [Tsuneonella dongtanensis]ANY18653.1 3-keto-5-aminohexanoate cleavage enzyme [Tsuneonella dongtanensis]